MVTQLNWLIFHSRYLKDKIRILHTVFTQLNTAAFITIVQNINALIIQTQLPLDTQKV